VTSGSERLARQVTRMQSTLRLTSALLTAVALVGCASTTDADPVRAPVAEAATPVSSAMPTPGTPVRGPSSPGAVPTRIAANPPVTTRTPGRGASSPGAVPTRIAAKPPRTPVRALSSPAAVPTRIAAKPPRTPVRALSSPAAVPTRIAAKPAGTVPPLAMRRSTPVRLKIQAIGLDTELISLGLHSDGTIEVPPTGFPAGWFTGAPTPGEIGPAVILGHWQRRDGVFAKLDKLNRGDQIRVGRADGSTGIFVVTRAIQVSKDTFPTDQVYGNIKAAGLRLITCGGLDPSNHQYDTNVIIFADLIGTTNG